MKFGIRTLLIAAVMLALIATCLMFGFSDFITGPTKENIFETKPWRPFARLALGFFLTTLTIIVGGVLMRLSFRNR